MFTSPSRLHHHRIDNRKITVAISGILLLNSFSRNDYIDHYKGNVKSLWNGKMWKGKNVGWSKKYRQLSTAEK